MSANNYLLIKQYAIDDFKVYECCADIVEESEDPLVRYGCSLWAEFPTLQDATHYANHFDFIEYGIEFDLLPIVLPSTLKERRPALHAEFIKFLSQHPELRLWQALAAFAGVPYILVGDKDTTGKWQDLEDTFYWEEKNG